MSCYKYQPLKNRSETKAVFVFRKSAAQFENPVCLFSSGKDCIL